jgi:hypothetical protein
MPKDEVMHEALPQNTFNSHSFQLSNDSNKITESELYFRNMAAVHGTVIKDVIKTHPVLTKAAEDAVKGGLRGYQKNENPVVAAAENAILNSIVDNQLRKEGYKIESQTEKFVNNYYPFDDNKN